MEVVHCAADAKFDEEFTMNQFLCRKKATKKLLTPKFKKIPDLPENSYKDTNRNHLMQMSDDVITVNEEVRNHGVKKYSRLCLIQWINVCRKEGLLFRIVSVFILQKETDIRIVVQYSMQ